MYGAACAPLVDAALQGFNATVFAYGQVGARRPGSSMVHRLPARATLECGIYSRAVLPRSLVALQTGSGKTHTMEGRDEPAELRGIIPRAFDHIFQDIQQGAGQACG